MTWTQVGVTVRSLGIDGTRPATATDMMRKIHTQPKVDLSTPSSLQNLRHQAEASVLLNPPAPLEPAQTLLVPDARMLIHELRVHQTELEMQNEELRRTQAELAAAQAHYFDLFDLAPVGYVTLNVQGLLLQTNLTAANLLGVARQDLPMRPISSYILGADQDIYYHHRLRLLASGEPQEFELRLLRAGAGPFWAQLTLTSEQAIGGVPMLRLVVSDITARHQLEDKVHQLAFYDELTQLPNRRLISDRLTHTMATSKRSGSFCALILLDLDNFKVLNDLRGHLVGDLLLMEVARRLSGCVREVDTVGRFGGDEFVVTLGELSADRAESTAQAATIAEKVRKSLAEPYLLLVRELGCSDTLVEHHCSASIGVLVFTDNDTSQNDILKRADAAMYQAKHDGRNRVHFYVDV
jgi:diguanylate cyclase (GGDEF)-like protein/PAS domain S-box-containing protein